MSNQVSILCSEKKEEKNSKLQGVCLSSKKNMGAKCSEPVKFKQQGIHQGPPGAARAQHSKVHHFLTFNYFFRFMQMYRETK